MCQNACFVFFKMKEAHSKKNIESFTHSEKNITVIHSDKNIESFREKHDQDFDTISFLQNSKNKRFGTFLFLKH